MRFRSHTTRTSKSQDSLRLEPELLKCSDTGGKYRSNMTGGLSVPEVDAGGEGRRSPREGDPLLSRRQVQTIFYSTLASI